MCGQENLEPKETVWHLISHFFNDITHFDGKFFSSVKYLVRKPGFLSKEYMLGRRASYLNPIRMYVFTSAIFFIIFFSLQSPEKVVGINEQKEVEKGLPALLADRAKLQNSLIKETDEDDREDTRDALKRLDQEIAIIKNDFGDTTTRLFSKGERAQFLVQAYTDSLQQTGLPPDVRKRIQNAVKSRRESQGTNFFGLSTGQYQSIEQYDSTEKALPDSLRDGWLKAIMMRKGIAVNQEYHRDKKGYQQKVGENILHSFPKILFMSLPFFALILNMLYFRHKQYFYVDHGIFTIHLYCANFILILIMILLNKLSGSIHVRWWTTVTDILIFALVVYQLIYLYKALRGFYGQRRGKTILKYFMIFGLAFIVDLIIFLIFTVLSAINIH